MRGERGVDIHNNATLPADLVWEIVQVRETERQRETGAAYHPVRCYTRSNQPPPVPTDHTERTMRSVHWVKSVCGGWHVR